MLRLGLNVSSSALAPSVRYEIVASRVKVLFDVKIDALSDIRCSVTQG